VTGINEKVLIQQPREMADGENVTHALAPHDCVCAPAPP
jgi:hypothetical protein